MRRAIWLAVGAWLLLWQGRAVFAPDLELGALVSRYPHLGVLAAGVVLCIWAAVAAKNRGERRAWILIGTGVAAWTFGEIYYVLVLWTAEDVPVPSPADGGYLLFPLFMLAGVLTLLRSRTSFVVAHRLSTIRHADCVLVLDQGRIIERGTHAELLIRGGHYAALYRQFVQIDEVA